MNIPSWVQDEIRKLGRRLRAAFVLRGGPENGPFSTMAGRILDERLPEMGIDVEAIYACSGSVSTALLGCTRDWPKLCDTWANLGPENVVGEISKFKTAVSIIESDLFNIIKGEPLKESLLENIALRELIKEKWDLKKIGSPESLLIKFSAVDLLTSKQIVFSNKAPGHIKWFLEGALGTMGLIPFLPPQRVYYSEEAGLVEKGKSKNNSLLLVDGGFMGNMLLEEAMRDGYDIIFLIDIHGLQPTETDFDVRKKYHWSKLLRSAFHILSSNNDLRQFQMDDRINEEIRIKKELIKLVDKLPPEYAQDFYSILDRMNNGRLRLGDKDETRIVIVSNPEHSTLFNFASFTRHKETIELLWAGEEAAYKTLEDFSL